MCQLFFLTCFLFSCISFHRCYCRKHYHSISSCRQIIPKMNMNDEYLGLLLFFFCGIYYEAVRMITLLFLSVSIFSLINRDIFPFFNHFLFCSLCPVSAVKWPIVKEQPVCVWDISFWFSGTLAWWMATQKTHNSRFACRETFSLRLNGTQIPQCLCSSFHCLTWLKALQNYLLSIAREKKITALIAKVLWSPVENAYR